MKFSEIPIGSIFYFVGSIEMKELRKKESNRKHSVVTTQFADNKIGEVFTATLVQMGYKCVLVKGPQLLGDRL